MNATHEPSLVATCASFVGDTMVKRETRYLHMPRFLSAMVNEHRDRIQAMDPNWLTTTRTESDISGQKFLIITSGPAVTLIWFDRSYESLYERG